MQGTKKMHMRHIHANLMFLNILTLIYNKMLSCDIFKLEHQKSGKFLFFS